MKNGRSNHRTHPTKTGASGPANRFPIGVMIGSLSLACAVVIAIWLVPTPKTTHSGSTTQSTASKGSSVWKVGMPRPDGLRIVVTGRDDASKVLDAQQFSRSEVRHGYWVATQIPAVLNKLYCWCGCENRGLHRSNLQCFEDEMAEDCPVCLGTAEIAYDMTRKGVTDAAKIQAVVDVYWGPNR